MLSIQGTYTNGVVKPDNPVTGRDGERVLSSFFNGGGTKIADAVTSSA
ncbi:MAG: hypothetical protein AB7U20_03200 [Planctomycetaceae bacterium]